MEVNSLFSVLAHERRRYALYCLQQYRNPMTLADLADEVAKLEYDEETVTEIPAEEVKSVYMSLYHIHIPKMNDCNIVTYEQEKDYVTLTYEFKVIDLEEFI